MPNLLTRTGHGIFRAGTRAFGRAVLGTMLAGALAAFAPMNTAQAQDEAQDSAAGDGVIALDLNKLEPREGACRAYMVVENATAHRLASYMLDLVIFDTDEVIANRLRVRLDDLRAGKTVVRLFDIPEIGCDSVGRVLLNEIAACETASGTAIDCLDLTRTASKARADFVQ